MSFTDFKSGLQNVNSYIDGRHHLSGTTALGSDALRIVAGANYSFTLRELICSVLGGHGFKLPNIQICLSANLNALLGLDRLQAALRGALQSLANSFNKFMDMLSIDSVLGRLNGILNEAINVANMINFCGTAINPVAIPNMIEQAFSSLLGKGDALIRKIGFPSISTCLSLDGSFNTSSFITNPGDISTKDPGIFGDIAYYYPEISTGTVTTDIENELVNTISSIVTEMEELIYLETNINGAYASSDDGSGSGLGGSDFADPFPGDDECSSTLGILHNPGSGTVAENTRIAAGLKSSYDQLAGYPVQYIDPETNEVIEYANIFHLIVTPAVLAILDKDDAFVATVEDQIPVYDYCGNTIGFTASRTQGPANEKSKGNIPTAVSCPGDKSAGLTTFSTGDATSESIATAAAEASAEAAAEAAASGNTVAASSTPFLLPQLTTIERDASNASNGSLIYNTTSNKIQGFQNDVWINIDGT
tara:strand:+ start:1830 stop:3263 length:1434 start_codon:yes stop_codon:yes gene_type:complete